MGASHFLAAVLVLSSLSLLCCAHRENVGLKTGHLREMLWNDNPSEAPLVTGDTIAQARAMEMADAASAGADATARLEAEHEAKRKQIVKDLLAKYQGVNPFQYFFVGLLVMALTFVIVYVGEIVWLTNTLSLASWQDPEVKKRMYPLI